MALALSDTLIIPTHNHCVLLGMWGIQRRLGSLEMQIGFVKTYLMVPLEAGSVPV